MTFAAPREILLSLAPSLISADKSDKFYTVSGEKVQLECKHISSTLVSLGLSCEGPKTALDIRGKGKS